MKVKIIISCLIFSVVLVCLSLFLWKEGNKIENRKFKIPVKTSKEKNISPTPLSTSLGGKIEIIATGNVMLGRTVMTTSLDKEDVYYPFRKVKDVLNSADLLFINLENPIVENCPRTYEGFKFCTTPGIAQGLNFAGVDIANLANNHTLNYGEEALISTSNILGDMGISFVGLGDLVIKEIDGVKFGFLGFDFFSKDPKEEDFDLIKESSEKVDILLVGVHWGVEYTSKPTLFQREWAKKIIDAGADVIIGHHPHWVQDMEYIDGKPVFYSLGNFVFDQMWSEETRKGLAVKLVFEGKDLADIVKLPIYMKNWAQPEFVNK